MARKNLARTVIEGGRYFSNSWMRRASNGQARARTREWLDYIRGDEADAAEATSPRSRTPVRKMFRDKLGPAKRWLDRQVGRPWAKVYAELCAKFDTRTVAGRHVVHDHLLTWVRRGDAHGRMYQQRDYVVDAAGILQRDAFHGTRWRKVRKETEAWRAGRRAVLTFRGWWWVRIVGTGPVCMRRWQCKEPHHHQVDSWTYHRVQTIALAPLTRGDRRRLGRLPVELRSTVVIAADDVVWKAR